MPYRFVQRTKQIKALLIKLESGTDKRGDNKVKNKNNNAHEKLHGILCGQKLFCAFTKAFQQ